MRLAGIYGLPGPVRPKRLRGVVTFDDLVNRKFARPRPNELWVTDITQHRTREGWVYCAAVLDAFSRRIVGWSIDSKQDTTLVIDALNMAIRSRRPAPGGIVHADHGTQFTSWLFGEKIRSAGLLPSFGSVGDGLDNAMMESFWSSMQIELLNRKGGRRESNWPTRSSSTSRSSTTVSDVTPPSATAHRSNTRHSKSTTSPPRVSDPDWHLIRRAGQVVTDPFLTPRDGTRELRNHGQGVRPRSPEGLHPPPRRVLCAHCGGTICLWSRGNAG